MDIKELDKKQLILLTLLITFVVSIATGIVTVSLMNQMPKSVPQTINNVIQRTIEKVTTVQVPTPATKSETEDTVKDNGAVSLVGNNGEALVSIYLKDSDTSKINNDTITSPDTASPPSTGSEVEQPAPVGQGVLISDIGLILVDSDLVKNQESYKVILDKIEFSTSVLKKYDNGFTILKISPIVNTTTPKTTDTSETKTQ